LWEMTHVIYIAQSRPRSNAKSLSNPRGRDKTGNETHFNFQQIPTTV
jgi:hypothetical protein